MTDPAADATSPEPSAADPPANAADPPVNRVVAIERLGGDAALFAGVRPQRARRGRRRCSARSAARSPPATWRPPIARLTA